MANSIDINKNHKSIIEFLSSHKAVTISYTLDNQPEACTVWYANEGLNSLYFLSSLSTKHGSTLRSGGNIALTIYKDDQDWIKISGIQGYGKVKYLGDLKGKGWDLYKEKFPFLASKGMNSLIKALKTARLWEINITWIRLIDNKHSFGYKIEIDVQ